MEALAEDKGPDIISISNREIGKYLSKIVSMPVSIKTATMQIVKKTMREETIINIQDLNMPNALSVGKEYVQVVSSDVVRGGKVYGLPLSLDTLGLYYNQDILDNAGVATPPSNWEEFQEAVKKTTRFDSEGNLIQSGVSLGTGENVSGSDDLLYILFEQSGVDFVTDEGLAVFNYRARGQDNPPAFNVMNFYTDFANPEKDTYSWNSEKPISLEAFSRGLSAFFFGYSFHYPQIKARAPQLNFEVLTIPQLNPDNPVNVANYYIQSVVKKSKKQDEAWGVIRYLAGNGNEAYLQASGRPTAKRQFIAVQNEDPALAPFSSQVLVAKNWYKGKNYSAARSAINEMLKNWIVINNNFDDIDEYRQNVLNNAASKINQTL